MYNIYILMIKKNAKTRKMKGGGIETRSIKKTDKKTSNLTEKTTIIPKKNIIPRHIYEPIPHHIYEPIIGGKTIVLYISAHGSENHKDKMPLASCQDTYIQTLSFAGHIGALGINVKPDNRPGFDSATLATIVNRYIQKQTDITKEHKLHRALYSEIHPTQFPSNIHDVIMIETKNDIIDLAVNHFPIVLSTLRTADWGNPHNLDPFQILNFYENERTYSLKPNHSENCVDENYHGYDHTNCPQKPILDQTNPFYGINIIYADANPGDKNRSFIGQNVSLNPLDHNAPDYEDKQLYGNMNENRILAQYWADRIINTKNVTEEKRNEIIEIYNRQYEKENIKLSEICTLFKFFGYVNIFIYDPSCRTSDLEDRIRVQDEFGNEAFESNRYTKRLKDIQRYTDSNTPFDKQRRATATARVMKQLKAEAAERQKAKAVSLAATQASLANSLIIAQHPQSPTTQEVKNESSFWLRVLNYIGFIN